ncbi:putative cytosol aminopeptidase [Betaproteobacteria bacterium]|nr:putative cytosol aminopeptidase [Betaproteobacteria bacterium]GHU41999.1 putative cytosol aminopeptidase [Betaproteobacteria bacterium]
MEFSIKSGSPDKQRSACVVVGIFESRKLSLPAELIDNVSGGHISDILRRGDMEGKVGSTLTLYNVPGTLCDRVLLVGLGKEKDYREAEFCKAVRESIQTLNALDVSEAILFLTESSIKQRIGPNSVWRIRQGALIAAEVSYRFDHYKSNQEEGRKRSSRKLEKVTFIVERRNELAAAEAALAQGKAIAEGIRLARDLGNQPANVCTPEYLADTARRMATEFKLDCEILGRHEMEKLGMHALLAVAKGSREEPRFIVLGYQGAAPSEAPLALIGKGVTFDSGGISLKPAAKMDEMKYDMCGAAAVLGTLHATARLRLPINLVALIPASENLPGGNATRPGDIVTSLSGQSIEILNTDAEGRLLLCDALTYAERLKPSAVIDVATLTGACVVALGHLASGLFTHHNALAKELLQAGESAQDRIWQLPLWEEYGEGLKSNFADMANVGEREGGAITAASFLSRFGKNYPWAHLDIAGTAWKSGARKSATGRPVALLCHFILQRLKQLEIP